MSNFPTWWDPIIHDRDLVTGTIKHGFGKWDLMFEDPSLVGFHALLQQRLAKGTHNNPLSSLPLFRLLRYLMTFAPRLSGFRSVLVTAEILLSCCLVFENGFVLNTRGKELIQMPKFQ